MRLVVLAAVGASLAAFAQERPDESAMFGSDSTATDAGVENDGGARPNEDQMFGGGDDTRPDGGAELGPATHDRDQEQLSGPGLKSLFDTGESKVDWLKIGGLLYLRGTAAWGLKQDPKDWAVTNPDLMDLYVDARPNDSVRGFALGRLTYDPTQPSGGTSAFGTPNPQNPAVNLDQLWLRFDIEHLVFLTVGRQKVKWGTGRLWQPTDFLNTVKRDPLQPFDLRLGVNAVKVHVPVEKLGWNFYGYGLLDNNGPANTLGKLGGGVRGEFVLGPAELGLDGAWVDGRRPRYGVDLSAALGPVDVYADVAFRSGADFIVYNPNPGASLSDPTSAFTPKRLSGTVVQATGGVAYAFNYTEKNTLTVGVEYFYNRPGATNPIQYLPGLYTGNFTFFYNGQNYVGVFASAVGIPEFTWITLNLTNLLNLSDPSGIVRFDAFFRVLTYLQFEVFVAANYGAKGGEFRFGGNFPAVDTGNGQTVGPFNVPYPVASAGLGLRLSL